ncbi:MAG: hypothetical protein AAF429_14505 [Pseudomonadota bacterium]
MPFDGENLLDHLEQEIVSLPSTEIIELPAPPPVMEPEEADALDGEFSPTPLGELLSASDFYEYVFCFYHETTGLAVSMRTGAPCPLGDVARKEAGRKASDILYPMILENPLMSKIFLNPHGTFLGQLTILGAHFKGCFDVIKASAQGETLPAADEVDHD